MSKYSPRASEGMTPVDGGHSGTDHHDSADINADYGHGTETSYDTNRDGYADELLVHPGDGGPDEVLTHSIGSGHELDTIGVDTNHDGRLDEVIHYGTRGHVQEVAWTTTTTAGPTWRSPQATTAGYSTPYPPRRARPQPLTPNRPPAASIPPRPGRARTPAADPAPDGCHQPGCGHHIRRRWTCGVRHRLAAVSAANPWSRPSIIAGPRGLGSSGAPTIAVSSMTGCAGQPRRRNRHRHAGYGGPAPSARTPRPAGRPNRVGGRPRGRQHVPCWPAWPYRWDRWSMNRSPQGRVGTDGGPAPAGATHAAPGVGDPLRCRPRSRAGRVRRPGRA